MFVIGCISVSGLVVSCTWSSILVVLLIGWVRLYCFPLLIVVTVCYSYISLQYISISSGVVLTLVYVGLVHLVWLTCRVVGIELVMDLCIHHFEVHGFVWYSIRGLVLSYRTLDHFMVHRWSWFMYVIDLIFVMVSLVLVCFGCVFHMFYHVAPIVYRDFR